ncbi:hypothetical protein BDV32DRAFT_146958 [Aspergillus pseudonomiae]|nr:hypothetical protein BDV32DRAFT_146958 [Aspergillus pseudonomiae]
MKASYTLCLFAFICIAGVEAVPQLLSSLESTPHWDIQDPLDGHRVEVRFYHRENGWFWKTSDLDLDQCFNVDTDKKELIAQDNGNALSKCEEEGGACAVSILREVVPVDYTLHCNCSSFKGSIDLRTVLKFHGKTGDAECFGHKGVNGLLESIRSKFGSSG